MIRPIEYCENISHIRTSIDTIDYRILELISLKKKYIKKAIYLNNDIHQVKADEKVSPIIKERLKLAKQFDLDEDFIKDLFDEMINYFINKELNVFNEKKNISNR